MPRRFFRKFAFKRQHLSELWFMSPFRGMLQDHRLWGIRRRTVVPAFSLGLFIAFLPTPGHTLIAALLALMLRVNIPVAALSTWVSNPVTIFIMYPGAYHLGNVILGAPAQDVAFALSWDWLTHTFVTIWQPMLLGSVILGVGAALLGYVGLDLLWRASIADYKSRKREIRNKRSR
ncbi:MAG: DUF2062 domain-containing protein [Gammaproteobacteria bacterium]|nr:DUF2062 domain-containing protein [Gammaproteobacteria bacterium]